MLFWLCQPCVRVPCNFKVQINSLSHSTKALRCSIQLFQNGLLKVLIISDVSLPKRFPLMRIPGGGRGVSIGKWVLSWSWGTWAFIWFISVGVFQEKYIYENAPCHGLWSNWLHKIFRLIDNKDNHRLRTINNWVSMRPFQNNWDQFRTNDDLGNISQLSYSEIINII